VAWCRRASTRACPTSAVDQHESMARPLATSCSLPSQHKRAALSALVDVHPRLGADRHGVRDAVEQVELLDRDRVDLVEDVDGGQVDAVPVADVDELLRGSARRVARERTSTVQSDRNAMSALSILYSDRIARTASKSTAHVSVGLAARTCARCVKGTVSARVSWALHALTHWTC